MVTTFSMVEKVLGTIDGSSEKNLHFFRESMPIPIFYEPGNFSVGGVILDDPSTWADLPQASCAATAFKQRVVDEVGRII